MNQLLLTHVFCNFISKSRLRAATLHFGVQARTDSLFPLNGKANPLDESSHRPT